MKKRVSLIIIILACAISLNAMSTNSESVKQDTIQSEKIDDWKISLKEYDESDGVYSAPIIAIQPGAVNNVGFSVGGAKDISNFRLNIEEGFLPLPSSITYEGLFYDYYFNTKGISSESDKLFSPSYNLHKMKNYKSETELWLSVGLESNLQVDDFERKDLNLVVVLDISGSMSSEFDQYYYDGVKVKEIEDYRSKLEIANETICNMLDHFRPNDRFGMVLFDDQSYLAKPLNLVGETNMEAIKKHIMEISTQGGTNMYAGIEKGTELFDSYLKADKDKYENRIIFLTDAMPNIELTDKHSLWGMIDENAKNGLYSTIIGVGVDFQTRLIEHISKVEGANYYSIHSAREFKKRLDDEFEFMVTPLVFNLNLVIDAEGYEIKRVCGTPYSAESSGEIMKVGTLFPSAEKDGEVKGGIILVELEQTSENGEISILAGYDDRNGEHHQDRVKVDFDKVMLSSLISPGLQKGALLVQYADLLMEWVEYMRDPDVGIYKLQGIIDWQYNTHQRRELNEWEQRSVPLAINPHYLKEFTGFKEYFSDWKQRLDDESLEREIHLMDTIINKSKIRESREPND